MSDNNENDTNVNTDQQQPSRPKTGLDELFGLEKSQKATLSDVTGRQSIVAEVVNSFVLEEKNKRIELIKSGLKKLESLKLEKRKIKPVVTYTVSQKDGSSVKNETFTEADFKKIEELNQKIKKVTDSLNLALDKADYSKLSSND